MADQRPPQTAKESKGFLNRLKKLFGRGSHSKHSNSPEAEEIAKLRAKYTHFRILVIGRANAGKTTLLKRVCNSKEDPVYSKINPTLKRGTHNVRDEFSFKSNPQFIFHDSPGFEAGGEQELRDVLAFIQEKAKAREVMDQIHAIWFCFTPNVSRPLLELEQRFFNEHRGGNVPVVAIFTKFDDLITQVYDRNEEEEKNRAVACDTLANKFEKPLKSYQFPPRAYVRFESIQEDEGNHQEQVGELIKQTAASIDDLALKTLFVTVQQNNLEICIEYAVNEWIFATVTMRGLIYSAMSWFKHCYWQNQDYGHKEKQVQYAADDYGADDAAYYQYYDDAREFVANVQCLVDAQFNAPSLNSLIAIIICLEHSFWIAQKGSKSEDCFTIAWEHYLKTQRALVDRELDDYLWSKGCNDWFATKYRPSEEECSECRKIVFKNLLPRPQTST